MRNLEGKEYTPNIQVINLRLRSDDWKDVIKNPKKYTKRKLG